MPYSQVRLPDPVTQRDHEGKALEQAFQKLGATQIVSGGRRNAIVVLQMVAGYPIGLDEGMQAMGASYERALATRHLPHLTNVIPDAQGEHSPAIPKLLKACKALAFPKKKQSQT